MTDVDFQQQAMPRCMISAKKHRAVADRQPCVLLVEALPQALRKDYSDRKYAKFHVIFHFSAVLVIELRNIIIRDTGIAFLSLFHN